MPFEVLEVEQLQRHAALAPLRVQVGAVRERALGPGVHGAPVEAGLEGVVGEDLDVGPGEAGLPGPLGHAGDGAQADPEAPRYLAVALPQGPLLSQDLADLSHG
jgi:hypothetical protein